jgi:hypothetical protein
VLRSLEGYNAASNIQERIKTDDIFVKITSGTYFGSIGKISKVDIVHYNRQVYFVKLDRIRKFNGTEIELTTDNSIKVVANSFKKEWHDITGKMLEIGQIVSTVRKQISSNKLGTVVGVIRELDNSGILIDPFFMEYQFNSNMNNSFKTNNSKDIIVLNEDVLKRMTLAKLSA